MNASFTNRFLAEPKLRGVGYRYGMLAAILVLLLAQIWVLFHPPAHFADSRYFGFLVPLMLLFGHLAYQFRWSQPTTLLLRIVAWTLAVPTVVYILFILFLR